ncbi:cytochrome o ubiquinol oxidase subunit IV [Roseovarius sp. M141]|uniref:cytochrome o ubiquinol oxidase subunit IV n=1 Tax=Roseovarius sp. M141 TaxID=2583806 RepID=UPI0020CF9E1B|nr:cytochrome o ubiquinol oxidase subunit IV [Roseovarius sp. M141]MCQ0093514.1 cytochrome o ubiquinol oxidase subunit IV [Roseovarius sp. M141]
MNDPDFKRELRSYLTGFGLALTLTLIPFGFVFHGGLAQGTVLMVIFVCALAQAVVHLRFFLHIDLSRQKREDLQLILFSLLLLAIMSIGTIWIMANLATRM